jgi:hypothetical protein
VQQVEERERRNRRHRFHSLEFTKSLEKDRLSERVAADKDEVETMVGREQLLHDSRRRRVEFVEAVGVDERCGAWSTADAHRMETGRQHELGGHRRSDHPDDDVPHPVAWIQHGAQLYQAS